MAALLSQAGARARPPAATVRISTSIVARRAGLALVGALLVLVLGAAAASAEDDDARGRSDWFFRQRAEPSGTIPTGALLRARGQAERLPPFTVRSRLGAAPTTPDWHAVGPGPITGLDADDYAGAPPRSGRVTAVAADPTNKTVAYVGGAAGGVWKTTDAGATWTPVFDAQPGLAIGALTIDPAKHTTIYAG